MCRSVPQIAVLSTLISTSLGPTSGTGASSIQMPRPASRLTSAFIICGIEALPEANWRSANYKRSAFAHGNSCVRAAGDRERVLRCLQRAPAVRVHRPREVVALQPVDAVLLEPGQLRGVLHALDRHFQAEAVRQRHDRGHD